MNQPAIKPPPSIADLQAPGVKFSMPARIVLIRHGQSDANVITKAIDSALEKKIVVAYPSQFLETPDREFRLTDLGVQQAKLTGAWLKKQYPKGFDRIYVSDHIRARETCGHMCVAAGWEDPDIESNPFLGERNWGSFAQQSPERRQQILASRKRDPINQQMPDGEAMLSARGRAVDIFNAAARQDAGLSVVYFTHGEFIEGVWSHLEDMDTDKQVSFFDSPEGDIKNCQVVEISAIDPFTQEIDGKLRWIRSSCPSVNLIGEWRPIQKVRYKPQQLIDHANRYPHVTMPKITEVA